LLEIMRRCVALPWVTETGSLAPSRGAGRGVAVVFAVIRRGGQAEGAQSY
jgi:hypothetical protein